MKLNIGAGKFKIFGTDWLNIDVEEKYYPDVLADFRTLTYEDIEEIRANHLLEHFSREESIKVLKQWQSWLKIGGRLFIETPDIDKICELVVNPDKKWANKEWMV